MTRGSASLHKVTRLRAWPDVGTTYLVPTIAISCLADSRFEAWPVFPLLHDDEWWPDAHHYHVDARFITEDQEHRLGLQWQKTRAVVGDKGNALSRSALSDGLVAALTYGVGPLPGDSMPKIEMKPLVCRYSKVLWNGPCRSSRWADSEPGSLYHDEFLRTGADCPHRARVSPSGRPLCPHQGFDLTAVWSGEDQVRCPMHGLLIDMREVRAR